MSCMLYAIAHGNDTSRAKSGRKGKGSSRRRKLGLCEEKIFMNTVSSGYLFPKKQITTPPAEVVGDQHTTLTNTVRT
eukprot:1180314-Prorocentrum_minimum.AAC.2